MESDVECTLAAPVVGLTSECDMTDCLLLSHFQWVGTAGSDFLWQLDLLRLWRQAMIKILANERLQLAITTRMVQDQRSKLSQHTCGT